MFICSNVVTGKQEIFVQIRKKKWFVTYIYIFCAQPSDARDLLLIYHETSPLKLVSCFTFIQDFRSFPDNNARKLEISFLVDFCAKEKGESEVYFGLDIVRELPRLAMHVWFPIHDLLNSDVLVTCSQAIHKTGFIIIECLEYPVYLAWSEFFLSARQWSSFWTSASEKKKWFSRQVAWSSDPVSAAFNLQVCFADIVSLSEWWLELLCSQNKRH